MRILLPPSETKAPGGQGPPLDPAGLTPAARRRADSMLVICSGLFGALRPSDAIPAYRLSGGRSLPRLGPLTALWRTPLAKAPSANDDPVIDLRSGGYAALAPLPSAVVVRVVSHDGRPVSHHNKAAKGRLARALVTARREPATLAAAIRAAQGAGLVLKQIGERQLVLIV